MKLRMDIIIICIIIFLLLFIYIFYININSYKNKNEDWELVYPHINIESNKTTCVNETVFFNATVEVPRNILEDYYNSTCKLLTLKSIGWNISDVEWDFDIRNGLQVDSTELNTSYVYYSPGKYIVTFTIYSISSYSQPRETLRKASDTLTVTVI